MIKDCNKAIQLNPDYIKAYHRRGKASFNLNNFAAAYQDFQFIMKKEPENKEVNADLRECRQKLSEDELKRLSGSDASGGFKRVQIIEDDDEEEEDEDSNNQEMEIDYNKDKKEADNSKKNAPAKSSVSGDK